MCVVELNEVVFSDESFVWSYMVVGKHHEGAIAYLIIGSCGTCGML